jgi:hypothetical protein
MPAARQLAGLALVTTMVGLALGMGAFALAAGPVRLGGAATLRRGSAAYVRVMVKVPRPGRGSAGTVNSLNGPVVASTGPAPARSEIHRVKPRASRALAEDIAFHLAAGNTEVARYVIPYEAHRANGCAVGFLTSTVDPSRRKAVRAEKKARGSRIDEARGHLGDEAVAHASEDTTGGLEVHVIVVQTCPEGTGT